MAEITYSVLNAPTVTQNEIVAVVRRDIPKSWNIPIFEDFPSDSVQLMDGYFERDFNQVRTYGPTQAEKHTWTFRMLRMEFNTPN